MASKPIQKSWSTAEKSSFDIQKQFLQLDYEESFLVKGCLEDHLQQNLTQLQLRNSLKYECVLEFASHEVSQEWSSLISDKAMHIENFLKKDRIEIGRVGGIQASSLNLQEQAALIEAKLDKKNDFDHLVKDDPLQLQQSYEATIERLSVVFASTSKFKLRSKCAISTANDVLSFSSSVPEQFNHRDDPDSVQDASEQDRFEILLVAK